MCLAIPTRVVELLPDNQALVDLGGVRKAISLELVDDVAVGDYVIIHVGYALTRLDPDEAARTLALMAEAGLDVGGAGPVRQPAGSGRCLRGTGSRRRRCCRCPPPGRRPSGTA